MSVIAGVLTLQSLQWCVRPKTLRVFLLQMLGLKSPLNISPYLSLRSIHPPASFTILANVWGN